MTAAPHLPSTPVALAAVRIGGDGESIPEIDLLSPRAIEPKRATFIAGRRAARAALAQRLGGALPADLRIEPDDAGCPRVLAGARELMTRVSITHAGGWALAAASDAPLGVDLVELEVLPDGMATDAFAPGEVADWHAVLDGADPRLAPCFAFAAKEAALKWLGVGMALALPSVRVEPIAEGGPARGWPIALTARLTHAAGRADLPLVAWWLAPERLAVLLGG